MTTQDKATGSDTNYYLLDIPNPKRLDPYKVECEDIIEALQMNFAEGNVFKAIWRSCAANALGIKKPGSDKYGVYDAEKIVYYGSRLVNQRKLKELKDAPEQAFIPVFVPPSTTVQPTHPYFTKLEKLRETELVSKDVIYVMEQVFCISQQKLSVREAIIAFDKTRDRRAAIALFVQKSVIPHHPV
jgi:hypothetical protein